MRNQAVHTLADSVHAGLVKAGVSVACGYPGYPVTPVMERLLERPGSSISASWTVNERVAVEMCMGASYCGARSTAIMKSHGINTVVDQLTNFSYTGVRGGFVLIVGDDIGATASQNDTDSRGLASFLHIPLVEPGTIREVATLLPLLFDFSEAWDTPAILRVTNLLRSDSGTEAA